MTLKGIIQTPEEEDEYYRNRGPIPPFQNEYGCIQDVVGYGALIEGKNYFVFPIILRYHYLSVSVEP